MAVRKVTTEEDIAGRLIDGHYICRPCFEDASPDDFFLADISECDHGECFRCGHVDFSVEARSAYRWARSHGYEA